MLTDGVGVITTEGLAAVLKALPVAKQKIGVNAETVSAIQIRIGGCKGVLARWDGLMCAHAFLHAHIKCGNVAVWLIVLGSLAPCFIMSLIARRDLSDPPLNA
jgi:hypothetical protein